MKNLNILAHVPYIGTTGYSNLSRSFLRKLSEFTPIRVRNFTIGENTIIQNKNGKLNNEPHNYEPYINSIDKKLLTGQVIYNTSPPNIGYITYPIYINYSNNSQPNIDLVIDSIDTITFDSPTLDTKIAYTTWETTLYPEYFFSRLKRFSQVWVASQWQKENVIRQGIDINKVQVIPHGVDSNIFKPDLDIYDSNKFKFLVVGKWEYRKSTKEIIECFLEEFNSNEQVELVLAVDTNVKVDKFSSTEERLKYYKLEDPKLKILHHLPQNEYIKQLQTSHVFLSCSRGEGWNLPLLEAMACGTPSIYSNCSGQLEFAKEKGIPVSISHMIPAKLDGYELPSDYSYLNSGEFYEPDFNDLKRVMREVYSNYEHYKSKALEESVEIREKFTWENSVKVALNTLYLLNN
jgi:glycosyltransferase involved in cell wall biosynthesis